ncbi:hypothetical protein ABPG77_010534 [Micractinium sp. CCAP 211/92]
MLRCRLCRRLAVPGWPHATRERHGQDGDTTGSEAYARNLAEQLIGTSHDAEAADAEDEQLPTQGPVTAAEVHGQVPPLGNQPQQQPGVPAKAEAAAARLGKENERPGPRAEGLAAAAAGGKGNATNPSGSPSFAKLGAVGPSIEGPPAAPVAAPAAASPTAAATAAAFHPRRQRLILKCRAHQLLF